ncbi:hypothetical protein J6590_099390 [Homalodisca vitripennis]|nr:hypothetical protein J6590_099390 [Homalodisca vitripennis]
MTRHIRHRHHIAQDKLSPCISNVVKVLRHANVMSEQIIAPSQHQGAAGGLQRYGNTASNIISLFWCGLLYNICLSAVVFCMTNRQNPHSVTQLIAGLIPV